MATEKDPYGDGYACKRIATFCEIIEGNGLMKKKIQVVITGGYRWSYYEWFLLGFYKLQERGEIGLKFRTPFFSKLLTYKNTRFGYRVLSHFQRRLETDTYNMTGYVEFEDGIKKRFTIDSSDAPFMFNAKLLKESDVYFKIQYPCEMQNKTFHLTPSIEIPWIDSEHIDNAGKTLTSRGERKVIKDLAHYRQKIYPLMQGPRNLSVGLSKQDLMKGYNNYLSSRKIDKTKKMMCYFGNALGPKPEQVDRPDYLWEGDVLGYFKERISHPNEKRAIVADYIAELDNSDARVISRAYADITKFQYNFNVSGYCKSIPNRFIESFMVGTAIMTDKLSVKWYLPFDSGEVTETVEMGYLPIHDVDWDTLSSDLKSLPESDPESIIKSFDKKWAPEVVAKYMLDTIRKG